MRIALVMSALLICGCGASHHHAAPPVIPQSTILDEALAKPEYADAIKQAERDLPDDMLRDIPWHMNVSREGREFQVATNILARIEPKLKRMSVMELVRSLKVEDWMLQTNDFSGVSEKVFKLGNTMITSEIKSRPKSELEVLPSLADGRVWIYTGVQGPPDTLDSLIHWEILHDR
jgi:hypothetical protein